MPLVHAEQCEDCEGRRCSDYEQCKSDAKKEPIITKLRNLNIRKLLRK